MSSVPDFALMFFPACRRQPVRQPFSAGLQVWSSPRHLASSLQQVSYKRIGKLAPCSSSPWLPIDNTFMKIGKDGILPEVANYPQLLQFTDCPRLDRCPAPIHQQVMARNV